VTRINWAGSSMAGGLLGNGGCVWASWSPWRPVSLSLLSSLPRRPLKHCWLARWMQISTHFDQNRSGKDSFCASPGLFYSAGPFIDFFSCHSFVLRVPKPEAAAPFSLCNSPHAPGFSLRAAADTTISVTHTRNLKPA
jgi:hypothetical protein